MNAQNSSISLKENINRIIEVLSIQAKLLNDGHNIIFLDEFKYWSESTNFFGWSVKNQNGYFNKFIDKFDLGFMIAFSKEGIKAITATKTIYTSEHFKYFLLKLIEDNSSDIFFFMDNAPIHKASLIAELCKSTNLCIIPIALYSPFLNPTEKLILFIKSKIRKIQKSGKLITLKVIQKVIDDISEHTLSKWIWDRHIETVNLIRKILS